MEVLQAQEVTSIFKEGPYWCVTTADDSQYGTHALLITIGARFRRLEAPGEANLIGTNIHFCATCDGVFYKNKRGLVVGGCNSGFEDGLFLTKFADQVDIVECNDKKGNGGETRFAQEIFPSGPDLGGYLAAWNTSKHFDQQIDRSFFPPDMNRR